MAEKEDTQVAEKEMVTEDKGKPTETEKVEETQTAPIEDEPVEAEKPTDAPDEKDVTMVINILNELQKINGGNGDIADIPPELFGVTKFILDKMIALKDAFDDPLFKEVLDDMVDQKDEGQTPSMLVAVARKIPMEELQDLADNEDYAGAQSVIGEGLNNQKQEQADQETMSVNFDKTKAEFEAYCKDNNYNDEERAALWKKVVMLMKVFGDGYISKNEFSEVDKMRNYDKDMESMRSQIPEEPKKEVLPDKASVDAVINPPAKKPYKPANSIEGMGSMQPGVDVTKIGSRKRKPNP